MEYNRPCDPAAMFLAVVFIVVSALSPLAQKGKDSLQTFTAPDGTFSFRYSRELIDCQPKGQEAQGPPKNCAAYFPVCGGETYDLTRIACFAYPRNKWSETGAFEAATFSVGVVGKIATEKDCLAVPSDHDFHAKGAATSKYGVSFSVFEAGEGAMNQSGSWRVYRAFHGGKCYQLDFDSAMANPQVFDPPANQLSSEGWNDINRKLEEPRMSFRFLK